MHPVWKRLWYTAKVAQIQHRSPLLRTATHLRMHPVWKRLRYTSTVLMHETQHRPPLPAAGGHSSSSPHRAHKFQHLLRFSADELQRLTVLALLWVCETTFQITRVRVCQQRAQRHTCCHTARAAISAAGSLNRLAKTSLSVRTHSRRQSK